MNRASKFPLVLQNRFSGCLTSSFSAQYGRKENKSQQIPTLWFVSVALITGSRERGKLVSPKYTPMVLRMLSL